MHWTVLIFYFLDSLPCLAYHFWTRIWCDCRVFFSPFSYYFLFVFPLLLLSCIPSVSVFMYSLCVFLYPLCYYCSFVFTSLLLFSCIPLLLYSCISFGRQFFFVSVFVRFVFLWIKILTYLIDYATLTRLTGVLHGDLSILFVTLSNFGNLLKHFANLGEFCLMWWPDWDFVSWWPGGSLCL